MGSPRRTRTAILAPLAAAAATGALARDMSWRSDVGRDGAALTARDGVAVFNEGDKARYHASCSPAPTQEAGLAAGWCVADFGFEDGSGFAVRYEALNDPFTHEGMGQGAFEKGRGRFQGMEGQAFYVGGTGGVQWVGRYTVGAGPDR